MTQPRLLHFKLFSDAAPTLASMAGSFNTLRNMGMGAQPEHSKLKPYLVSGGGFDTLVGCFVWLYAAYAWRRKGVLSHLAHGVTFAYGQSTAAIETAMAQRQLDFLNAGLEAINQRPVLDTTPLEFYLRVDDPTTRRIRTVHDLPLDEHLREIDHPITWNHVVPHAILPRDNAGVVSRNIRFLQAAQMYAHELDANTLLFGAQGSGPDVSIRWVDNALRTLFHGNDDVPLAIQTPAVGTLKSVGFTAIDEAGGTGALPYLGFSCQTDNGWLEPDRVPLHCGVCFRCDINALNLKRAHVINSLACLSAEEAAARYAKEDTTDAH